MISLKQNFELVTIILTDMTRNLFRVLLVIAVLGSAIAVILSTHHNRQMLIQMESAMQERDSLDVEWRNLVLEQGALSEHNRIESIVKKQLDMYRPSPEDEVVVRVK